jgi:hypothetical protein
MLGFFKILIGSIDCRDLEGFFFIEKLTKEMLQRVRGISNPDYYSGHSSDNLCPETNHPLLLSFFLSFKKVRAFSSSGHTNYSYTTHI